MRSTNELSKKILRLAQKGFPRIPFLERLSEIVLKFTECDALDIRLADTDLPYIWSFTQNEVSSFQKSIFVRDNDGNLIPCQSITNAEEYLCNELFQRRYNPELKYYYQKSSILVDDGYHDHHYRIENELDLGNLTGYTSLLYLSFVTSRDINGILVLKSNQKQSFSTDDVIILESLAASLGIAIAFQRSQYALRERVKELTCLHQMNKLLQRKNLEFNEISQQLVDMVPDSFQFPEHTCCWLQFEDAVFKTANFRKSKKKLKSFISVEGEQIGLIEVFLTGKDIDFLAEEYDLLSSIAVTTGAIYRKLKSEKDKKAMRDQLRHADRLATIGQLAAGIAHELNEPLANVLGYAELMQQELQDTSLAAADLKKIINSSLHARDVVRKLLLFARQMPTNLRAVNLNESVRESIQFLDSRISKYDVELCLELGENLGLITADTSQIKQVIINLVVNAQQAMPNGGKITLTTTQKKDFLILKVKDNGIGMSTKILKKIYLPFFTTKQPGDGTGLGLSVVYGIVNAHEGKIMVNSTLNKGTEFTVILPLRKNS